MRESVRCSGLTAALDSLFIRLASTLTADKPASAARMASSRHLGVTEANCPETMVCGYSFFVRSAVPVFQLGLLLMRVA